jgi:hypothetical protein
MALPRNKERAMRVRLGYYDQNERFAPLLRRDGTVERFVVGGDGQPT